MTKLQRIAYWILLTLVTLGFLAVGALKLSGSQVEIDMFTKWGYPIWFMYFIGTCEVLGAIGLNAKRVSRLAAVCLIILLCGAVGTHVFHNEGLVATIPATTLMLFLLGILYLKTKETSTATTPVV